MIEGGKDIEKVTVNGTLTGFERKVSGVGFRLETVSGSAQFPVHVIVDDDAAKPVVVQGTNWFTGSSSFRKLKVDVTPSGGQAGDEWRLFISPTESDRESQRLATDGNGDLRSVIVGTTGMKLLFELDSDREQDALMFTEAWREGATGVFYILPGAPGQLTFSESQRTPAWDVSRWANVMMVIDQELRDGADGADCILTMAMETTHAELGAKATEYFGAGTNGNFGIGGGSFVWDQTSTGYIHLGAAPEAVGDFYQSSTKKHPYARFSLNMAGSNTEAWDTYFTTRRLWVRGFVW